MKELTVRFADLNIKIHTHYDYMHTLCKDYIIDTDKYDIEVYPEEDYEHIMNDDPSFTKEYCESLSIYQQIGKQLPMHNAFIMHGACITYKDKGLLFSAPSGTGKTTHIRLWKDYFKEDVDMINGDKPIIRITKQGIIAYGTPYCGKERWHKNRSAKLHSICIITRGLQNSIKKITPGDAIIPLYAQIYFPKDSEESAGKTMELFDQLLKHIPVYILKCDISHNAVETSYKGMITHE